MIRAYARAYADCYRWLYQVCPPWRWLLSAGLWPGSPLRLKLAALPIGSSAAGSVPPG